ncbi:MAG: serine/threonine-protein kinase [Myxococcota bacterium]
MTADPTQLSESSVLSESVTGSKTPTLVNLPGTVLSERYELGEILGAGGMGAVFKARDRLLDRTVAVKVIRPALLDREEYIKRFLREAKVASKINHPNVVILLDYGHASGLVYSVMEFLEGQDLKAVLREAPDRRLPWEQACELLLQIARGLKAAHAEGVIHRDIKPANCFVTMHDGEPLVKLLDFGIAKLDADENSQTLTRTSQVMGTPSYIAPELVRTKQEASPRSDVYSLGVMAYRMLTGHLPFIGETSFEVMYRACTDPVPPLSKIAPDLPAAAEALVLQMLDKQPQRRPADMREVRERLKAVKASRRRGGWWTRLAVVGVLVGVIVGGGVVWAVRGSTSEEEVGGGSEAVVGEPADAEPRAASGEPEGEAEARASGLGESVDERAADRGGSTGSEDTDASTTSSEEKTAAGQPQPKAKRSRRRPSGPPPDGKVIKQLKRKIAKLCPKGGGITLRLRVNPEGHVIASSILPKGERATCAEPLAVQAKFQPRDRPAPLVIRMD